MEHRLAGATPEVVRARNIQPWRGQGKRSGEDRARCGKARQGEARPGPGKRGVNKPGVGTVITDDRMK